MLQTRPNITQKYCQETRYNYVGNSGFFASNCSPLLCYRFVSTTLTAQIPTETLSQSHRLCFIGKEKDSETGFSYFGARYYDSDLMTGWLSVDPMADKYPSLSPYNYCAWNPIKLVDPDGEDVWELNNEGRIVNRITTTEVDAFHIVDDKGNRLAGKSIEFEYGTVESHRSISYFNEEKKAKDTYDVYQVRGDDNGTKLFEFLAINIAGEEIEASHAKCGISGENGLNFITTAHLKPRYEIDNEGDLHKIASEPAMSYFLNDQLLKGYTIRELNHSHPFTDKKTDNDKRFASQIRNILGKKKENIPIFNIYHVKTNTYIRF